MSSVCFLAAHRPSDGEHRSARPVAAAGVQPAPPLPAAGTRLRRTRPALHRQRGAEERGGKVQRFTAHHTESTGTHTHHTHTHFTCLLTLTLSSRHL